jgi:hypothetical protein
MAVATGLDLDDESKFELEDAKGSADEDQGISSSSDGTTTEMRFSYRRQFQNAGQLGPLAKLVYTKTTAVIDHVPCVFNDLPLP